MSTSNGTNGTGRIHLLGHQSARPTKAEQQTADEQRMAQAIQDIAEATAVRVAEHYAKQVPGLVATMLGQILAANGLTLKPPPEWGQVPAVAPKALDDALDDAPNDVPSATNEPTESEGRE